jgi:hypothetical protein
VGTCPITAPCLTIAYALTQTAVAGQVIILDSGDYAPFTVTQGVSVRGADGVYATITATSGTAVTINAPTTDTVTLSNLHVFGFGQKGTTGVQVNSAGKVQIFNGSVASFSANGILVAPSTNTNVHFILSGTFVGFNGAVGSGGGNVLIMPTGSTSVNANIKNVYVNHSNNFGIKFDTETTTGAVYGEITDSHISYHTGSAINAHSLPTGGANVNVVVAHTMINFCSRTQGAVYADGTAAGIALNYSSIVNAAMAWGSANGGTTYSYGTNAVNFNTTASSPTSTLTLQ